MLRRRVEWSLAFILLFPLSSALADETNPVGDETIHLMLNTGRSETLSAPWPVDGVNLTDPTVAEVQVLLPDLLLVEGRGIGVTDLLFWDQQGRTQTVRIEVGVDLERLRQDLGSMLPGVSLDVAVIDGVVVLSGTLPTTESVLAIRDLFAGLELPYVDRTRVAGVQQVMLQVRLAEVSRTASREFGINGFGTGPDAFGASTIGPSSGGALNPFHIGPPLGGSAMGNTPFVFTQPTSVSPSVTLFGGIPKSDLEIFIRALAENQYLRVLAEPNLVAMSGETAHFLAGGEFPIPVVQGGGTLGGTSITIEYKEFGVQLNFRPLVQGNGAIRLEVASEVSELSDLGSIQIQGFNVPSVITRTAETTLEMGSGQTFAMAGLISEDASAITSRVPGLGDLPVLGSLFRSVRYRKGETELLVLVTASLVEPISESQLPPLPGTTHLTPNDWELYVEGRIEGRAPARLAPSEVELLRTMKLDELQGPGAWMSHEQPPAHSRADSMELRREWAKQNEVEIDASDETATGVE